MATIGKMNFFWELRRMPIGKKRGGDSQVKNEG
jgi:hypothetical protein